MDCIYLIKVLPQGAIVFYVDFSRNPLARRRYDKTGEVKDLHMFSRARHNLNALQ